MDIISMHQKALRKNRLFRDMPESEIKHALDLMDSRQAFAEKGTILHKPWTPLSRFGIVLTGCVQACCDDINGNRMIMADVQPGVTFGESLWLLRKPDSPVYIYASEDTCILWLCADVLFEGSSDPAVKDLQERFMMLLAERTLTMNNRIQILSKLSIREKITVYLSQMAAQHGSAFEIPLNREDMAVYIGTNRTALSRELSAMKKDGIIDYRKNRFVILKHMEI